MLGKTISHYKVLEKIGQGGMGEVYLAEETKLRGGRRVTVLAEANRERLSPFSPKIKKAPIRHQDRGLRRSASAALGFPATGSPGA